MKMIILHFLFVIFLFSSANQAQNFWQPSEFPSLYSGDIIALDAIANIAIASSYQDGLAISTNFGQNWFASFPTENFQPYSSVAISNSGYLFALGSYLYRSTDTGITWLQITNIQFYNAPNLTTSSNGNIYIASHQGVHRSTDEGETWTLQNVGLVIGGSSPFVKVNISSNGILVAATPSGVFKSTNNADTWIRISAIGATNIAVNSMGYVYVDKYRENPYLYVDTLYRTTNNGVSWEPLKNWRGLLIYINPTDDAIALADYDYYHNYFLSTNYGMTWTTINTDRSPVQITDNGNGSYLMGTHGVGLFKSNSLSGNWQACNTGFPGTVTKVTSVLSNMGIIFAATNSLGVYFSNNDGLSFSKLSADLDNLNVGKLTTTTNHYMFAIDVPGTILRSTNLGTTWSYYLGGGVLYDLVTYSLCSAGSIVITGGRTDGAKAELDRSTDNGTTWNEVFSIPGSSYETEYNIIALAIERDGLALGCVEKRHNINPPMPTWEYSYAIIRSSDYGFTWNTSNYNFDKIKDFAWNSLNEIFAITSQGLLKSIDEGLTWNYTTGTILTQELQSIAIDFDDDIYIGTGNRGVIYSTDNGNYWITLNEGMADSIVHSLCISSSGYLFAGTEFGGVFRSVDTINPVINAPNTYPEDYVLHQNYPNPFNPSTTIKYTVPTPPVSSPLVKGRTKEGFVSLKVFDVLGNEVATLVNEDKPAGEYDVEFNAGELPSGIYFYTLMAGEFIQTRKMVLLR